jgi:hypothetical protein
MRKVKMRITRKESADKEVTDYLDAAVNIDHVVVAMPSGMEGIVLLMMSNGNQHLVKGEIKDWAKK